MSHKNQEEFNAAMNELDQLSKSQITVVDEIDELTKALEAELGEPNEEPIIKSTETEVVMDQVTEDISKSEDHSDDDYSDELVKASMAYAGLEKSVHEGIGATIGEIGDIKKSLAALLNLSIKQAHVVVSLAKSRDDRDQGMEQIVKSMDILAAAPIAPNKAMLGTGSATNTTTEKSITKSHSEIKDDLLKAINEGHIAAGYLSIYDTYKDINRLPEEVRKQIGL